MPICRTRRGKVLAGTATLGLLSAGLVFCLRPSPREEDLWNRAVRFDKTTLQTALLQSGQSPLPDVERLHAQRAYQIEQDLALTQAEYMRPVPDNRRNYRGVIPAPPANPAIIVAGFSLSAGPSPTGRLGFLALAYKEPLPSWQRWLEDHHIGWLHAPRHTRDSLWVFSLASMAGHPDHVAYLGSCRHTDPDNSLCPYLGAISFTPDDKGLIFHHQRKAYVIALPSF